MSAIKSSTALSNQSVLITRPQQQSEKLAAKLQKLGAFPIIFPAIEIIATDLDIALDGLPFPVSASDIMIFVSVNAVQFGLRKSDKLSRQLTTSVQLAAIGASSKEQLMLATSANVLSPRQKFDSESLLQLAEFDQVKGKNIIIVKGVGGRKELFESLTNRGAKVASLDVYQRRIPQYNNQPKLPRTLHVSLFSSSESVDNILTIIPESFRSALLNSQVITGHPRIAAKVTSLGFKKLPIIADSPTDAAMLAALIDWANKMEIKKDE